MFSIIFVFDQKLAFSILIKNEIQQIIKKQYIGTVNTTF